MAVNDPGNWAYNIGSNGNSFTITTNTTWDSNSTTWGNPVVIVPPPMAPPVDDSPLAWLRRSVEEVTELAWAA